MHLKVVAALLLLLSLYLYLLSPFTTPGPDKQVLHLEDQLQLPPQQLVDLKDFQFTMNNNICGRRTISIAHRVAFKALLDELAHLLFFGI